MVSQLVNQNNRQNKGGRMKATGIFIFVLMSMIGVLGGAALFAEGDPSPEKDRQLFSAIEKADLPSIEKLIASGADINAQNENWRTPLMEASRRCLSDIMKFLIEKGANVNKADNNGYTSLWYAATSFAMSFSQIPAMNHLIEANARVNDVDYYGTSILMHAASYGDLESVTLLIRSGADVYATNAYGFTALDFAEGAAESLKRSDPHIWYVTRTRWQKMLQALKDAVEHKKGMPF